MTIKTDCFLACRNAAEAAPLVAELSRSMAVGRITILLPDEADSDNDLPEGCHAVAASTVTGSDAMGLMAGTTEADYALLCTKAGTVAMGMGAVERMVNVAEDSGAAMVYADRWAIIGGNATPHPAIDYQEGSIRDDFDFGPVMMFRADLLRKYATQRATGPHYMYAGLYDLRLFLSREGRIFHLGECLYTEARDGHEGKRSEAIRLRKPRQPRRAGGNGAGCNSPPGRHRRDSRHIWIS